MRALVTGATGKVGNAVARALVARGDEVRALVRDPARAVAVLPEGVEPVRGDVTFPDSVVTAAEGCELVFNAMGLPEQWLADEGEFEHVNAIGSETVVRAAARAGARRVIHTSTIDVFHAADGARFDESRVADYPKGTAYERSKQHAERLVVAAAKHEGIELVIANPAAVYGPGPEGSASIERDLLRPVVEGRRAAGRAREGTPDASGPTGQGDGGGRRANRPADRQAAAAAEGPAALLPLERGAGLGQGSARARLAADADRRRRARDPVVDGTPPLGQLLASVTFPTYSDGNVTTVGEARISRCEPR